MVGISSPLKKIFRPVLPTESGHSLSKKSEGCEEEKTCLVGRIPGADHRIEP
jgi:hypothetical protein